MFKRQALIYAGIAALSCLFAGCGVRPQVDFYVNPVATGERQRVDADTGSVAMELGDVSIAVSAVDTVDLMEVTSDVHVNPYVYVSDWGVVRPRYTIFDVNIKNNGELESNINLSDAVLMDEQGEQYDAIPYEELMGTIPHTPFFAQAFSKSLRERYEAYPGFEREIVYYPSPRVYHRRPYYRRRWRQRRWYYHYDRGHRPYYVRRVYGVPYVMRAILKGTMLKPIRLYPGGKQQGFLVFPIVAPDASELKIIFPGVLMEGRPLDLRFERIPAMKDQNDNKEDAGAG